MKSTRYTCGEYRLEMLLIALRRRLTEQALTADQRRRIECEIEALEKQMGLD